MAACSMLTRYLAKDGGGNLERKAVRCLQANLGPDDPRPTKEGCGLTCCFKWTMQLRDISQKGTVPKRLLLLYIEVSRTFDSSETRHASEPGRAASLSSYLQYLSIQESMLEEHVLVLGYRSPWTSNETIHSLAI